MPALLHNLISDSALRTPDAAALIHKKDTLSYTDLDELVGQVAAGLMIAGLERQERVAVYLPKQTEAVAAMFGAVRAGGVFVPVNTLLKPEQVGHILRDCNVRVLVTSAARARDLGEELAACHDLNTLILTDGDPEGDPEGDPGRPPGEHGVATMTWSALIDAPAISEGHRTIDTDMAAILYTSGSTGKPKGVVLCHRNMIAGAESVSSYLGNTPDDRLLAVLPFSFDYGFSQLSTAFLVGAQVVLIEYLLPRDVVRAVERHGITGLAGVPPLWNQLSHLPWPEGAINTLRYMTNSGGAMPTATLNRLTSALPKSEFVLMYGLTEAFRSTYLPPSEMANRPESMGKAIPNAEVMVVREDGTACAPGEPGELVHRGSLVSLGYWNDPEKTAERFKPAPGQPDGIVVPELAVWSGDTAYKDDDGFLYFVGRRDDMIKTSGYRVSPTEIEEVAYASGLVGDASAIGVAHPVLGQAIVVAASPRDGAAQDTDGLIAAYREHVANYMVPAQIVWRDALPRNPNGKINRKQLASELADLYKETT